MNTKHLKTVLCALATLGAATLVLGAAPAREPLAGPAFNPRERLTLEQAAKYAQSVVLLKRVVEDNQVHSYVKEVWRSRADAPPPAVGSEYGRPAPCDPRMRYPERDAILFEFGAGPAKGLEHNWRIPVDEKRRVPNFLEEVPVLNDDGTVRRMAEEPMHVDDVRSVVKRTKPEMPAPAPEPVRAATDLREIHFKITSEQFDAGDSIVIEQVLATSPELKIGDTVLVRGRYALQSRPRAGLGFFLTTYGRSEPTPISPRQMKAIAAGTGTFELEHVIAADGSLHVSFYPSPRGSSFGGVYFASALP